MGMISRFPTRPVLGLILVLSSGVRAQTVVETGGVAMIQAENPSENIPRTIGATEYAWVNSSSVTGYAGTGFMEAGPMTDNP